MSEELILAIKAALITEKWYPRVQLKAILDRLYKQYGYNKVAKHTDLEEIFNVKYHKSVGERYVIIINKHK